MAKRFTDTGLGRKSWFRKLSPRMKCAWRFLLDECDHAGVWSIDMDAMSFHIGEDCSKIGDLLSAFNAEKERIFIVEDNKIFIPDFIDFQYGSLSEDCKPHLSVINRLKKIGLYEGYVKGIHRDKDQDKDKDKVKDNEKEVSTSLEMVPTKSTSFNPSSPAEILSNIPIFNTELWAKLYPDQEFLDRELMRGIAHWMADPKKQPQTRGVWAQKLGTWLENSWRDHQKAKPKKPVGGMVEKL